MVRVHELAKELNLSSKDTITLLSKVGIRASTHMSVIDEHRARIVKGVLVGDLAQAAKSHKPVAKKATAGNGAATAEASPPPVEPTRDAAVATATAPVASAPEAAAPPPPPAPEAQ